MKTSLRLEDGTKNSLQIPIDLIIEIFLRLSVNSIARCRCVSKQWASTLSRPYFTELFLTRSLARPKLLFAYRKVCFDVRSEEFRFIIGALHHGSLINYNGKLSLYLPSTVYSRFNGVIRSIKLWVLEDAKRQEWSEHTYILPAMHDIMKTTDLRCVGMTQTKEFVFWSIKGMRFYVFYYNIERNTIKKVEMQGMEAFKESNVYTFLDHVEDVKLMQFF
ncbi:F-box and associated interaction domains-containing protein [Arabidopsis thaliana]|uniref:F-box and associated interaction domains-containing protein n=1 Tax=Arabidopsis thaliana TaxID=3702 RepID=B3H799_ARATH|nr:F-box and associated interaction domains-containing protein [Arabidopsis thaliana]AEC06905.1 F-box and associated interaction domains-containing protein [Arabidopsis thaliana]|eukprot:NP_001118347.1 F-box and associated interaction domains-containing protein [Arabidopsis thaliana]